MTRYSRNPPAPWSPSARVTVALLLAVWFVLAALAGKAGMFAVGPDQLARPVLLTILGPTALFLGVYAGSRPFRTFILTRDIRFITVLQSWRVIGMAQRALITAFIPGSVLTAIMAVLAGLDGSPANPVPPVQIAQVYILPLIFEGRSQTLPCRRARARLMPSGRISRGA